MKRYMFSKWGAEEVTKDSHTFGRKQYYEVSELKQLLEDKISYFNGQKELIKLGSDKVVWDLETLDHLINEYERLLAELEEEKVTE